jgi:hypothetical protein
LQPLVAVALLSLAHIARADDGDSKTSDKQVVLVNATAKTSSLPGIDRVRRVLDGRGLVQKLPPTLEAVLDGRNLGIPDLDQIREAFGNSDFKMAKSLIDDDERRILAAVSSGDPVPALAELSQWRGLIAAIDGDDTDAVSWFRAAIRFNPMWAPDKKVASAPSIKRLVTEAKHDPPETGRLRIDADPDDAQVRIDGKDVHASREKIDLPIGVHLVTVSAPDHSPVAALAHIKQGALVKLPIALPQEGKGDRVGRLLDATVSAPAGKSRLKAAKPLAKLISATRLLYFEDATEDHLVLRLYDLEAQKVSPTFEIDGAAASSAITRKVLAALDSEEVTTGGGGSPEAQAGWYNHWYVWVGAAVVAGLAIGTYEYASRSATHITY